MAKGGAAKWARESKPYEDKSNMVVLLGFDTEKSFDKWRVSSLVHTRWEIFVEKFLKADLLRDGRKVADFASIRERIREGEKAGRRRYSDGMRALDYQDEMDWHAWLT